MASLKPKNIVNDWLFSIIFVAAMGLFTQWVLEPKVGIDDANITQAYARNIALGHGYVYNIGGERVEGSTSALWTAINTVGFLFLEKPYFALALFNAVLCSLMLFISLRATRILAGYGDGNQIAGLYPVTALGFVAFPAFFGWMIWSLMETALWAANVTIYLFLALVIFNQFHKNGKPNRRTVVLFVLSAAVLPLCRPEGVALAIGVGVVFTITWALLAKPRFVWPPVIAILAALSSATALYWVRSQYFGFPHPNTYYAKISDAYISQAISGARYTFDYFQYSNNLLLFLGAVIGIGACILSPHKTLRQQTTAFYGTLVSATVAGAVLVYTLLGGDHFGSHRFYMFFVPLLMPFFVIAVQNGLSLLTIMLGHLRKRRVLQIAAVLPTSALLIVFTLTPLALFSVNLGWFGGEFSLAETGRTKGRILRDYPGDPSLGVIAAGGVRMGYDGQIFDLLGLNWVAMAMAKHDPFNKPKNHGGFNADVFFEHEIDIVDPRWFECNEEKFATSRFTGRVLGGLFQNPDFVQAYRFECLKGLAFFVRRDYATKAD